MTDRVEIRLGHLTIPIPAGEDPDEVYWRHCRAALAEGRCGNCLEAVTTDLECERCHRKWHATADEVGWALIGFPLYGWP